MLLMRFCILGILLFDVVGCGCTNVVMSMLEIVNVVVFIYSVWLVLSVVMMMLFNVILVIWLNWNDICMSELVCR